MKQQIEELDLDQLDADLYSAWKAIEKGNYGTARARVATCWAAVRRFRLSLDDRHLPSTQDRDVRALVLKVAYWLFNRWPLKCRRLGYNCEWVYPYGWVPEGGCPQHD